MRYLKYLIIVFVIFSFLLSGCYKNNDIVDQINDYNVLDNNSDNNFIDNNSDNNIIDNNSDFNILDSNEIINNDYNIDSNLTNIDSNLTNIDSNLTNIDLNNNFELILESTKSKTIKVDNRNRNYLIFVPENNGQKLPVVFVLHGGAGNLENAQRMSDMTKKAKDMNFIVIYPNGTGILNNSLLTWNGGNCCGYAVDNNIDDIKFFKELIEKIKSEYNVNEKMIYFTGLSNGAFMSHRIACELSSEVAAIAPVAGSIGIENCNPSEEVSVIIFHGTADEHVSYYGGVGEKQAGSYRIDKSVEYTFNLWKEKNNCEDEISKNEFGSIVHEKYSNCSNNSSVELYTIINQGHAWPGGIDGLRYGNVDTPTKEISATDLMIDFFFAHPKN